MPYTPSGTLTSITASGPTLTYIGAASDATSQTTYNFGDFTAASDGLMVAMFCCRGDTARTVSSVSIGGSSGTIWFSNPSQTDKYAIASRVISSGANNVTVTLSGASGVNSNASVNVYLFTNYISTTPYWASGGNAGAVTSIATERHSVCVYSSAIYTWQNNGDSAGGPTNLVWTTATQDVGITAISAQRDYASAHRTVTDTEAVGTMTASWTTTCFPTLLGAAWR